MTVDFPQQGKVRSTHAVWFVFATLAGIVLISTVPVYYSHVAQPISSDPYRLGQFNIPFQVLIGLSDLASSLMSFGLALLLFWRKPNDRMTLFVSFFFLITAVTSNDTLDYFLIRYGGTASAREIYRHLQTPLWILLFCIFPDGHFVPRWTRWVFLFSILASFSFLARSEWRVILDVVALPQFILVMYGQVYRYRRVSSDTERQQTKWVVFGVLMEGVFFVIASLIYKKISPPLINIIPLTLAIAILRSRLWDIDIIINRTLVYGTLSAGIVVTYILLIGLLGELLNTHVGLAAALLTAALAVPFFQPLRVRLQRAVNRVTIGGRDMPSPKQEIEESQPDSEMPLRQRRLEVIHSAWFVCAVLAAIVLISTVPIYYSHIAHPILADPYNLGQSNITFQVLVGVSDLVSGFLSFALALLLFWRKPNDRMALFASFFFLITSVASNDTLDHFLMGYVGTASTREIYRHLQIPLWILLFCIFPDGRFVPRWTRWVFLFSILASFSFLIRSEWRFVEFTAGLPFFLVTYYAQVYRYRHVSSDAERQQTKWVVLGWLVVIVLSVIASLIYRRPSGPLINILPLMVAIAILRSRLWDIDLIINRTLVYGALTAGIVALYILLVGALSIVSQTTGNLLISLLATGLIAFLFQSLRERLQRGVNRLVYGERDDPYAVLSRLGQRLEAAYAPESVLPTIVETVAQTLKLPYVAIALNQDGELKIAAEFGRSKSESINLSLSYQGEPVGELILAPRAPGEHFTGSERQLLDDLARQAGVAAHAVRLTADLQRSRERLVAAREEERRRLRRDLHDGLGPQLASLALKLEAARNRMADDPHAVALLTDLSRRTQEAVADIRRLVYALRPPALDELGLVMALREGAMQYNQQGINGLNITFDAPEKLPALPAAVEVAAYRIAQESLTNVVRHAEARTCLVRLRLDESAGLLCLEVRDDGQGLPIQRRAGVGLNSMRERAEELGGTLMITSLSSGGTSVLASLPCQVNEPSHRADRDASLLSQGAGV